MPGAVRLASMTAIPATRRPTPRWVKIVAVASAVAAAILVAGVYAAGGFNQRSDWEVRGPGEEMDAGNLVFTAVSATAQRGDAAAGGRWTVLVTGTVRNPQDSSLAPILGDRGNLFARDHSGGTVSTLASARLGDDDARTEVPPDNRPLAMVAQFRFETFEPGTTLDVAVARMEFTDNSVLGLGGGAKEWNVDSAALLQMVSVPLTVLPPKT